LCDEKMAKTKLAVVEDETITAKEKMLKDLGYDAPAIASSDEEFCSCLLNKSTNPMLVSIRKKKALPKRYYNKENNRRLYKNEKGSDYC